MIRQAVVRKSKQTVWNRIIQSENGTLNRAAATFFSKLDFTPADHDRIAELNDRANEGSLSPQEREELEEYIRVGDVLTMLQAKARRSLRKHGRSS